MENVGDGALTFLHVRCARLFLFAAAPSTCLDCTSFSTTLAVEQPASIRSFDFLQLGPHDAIAANDNNIAKQTRQERQRTR